MGCQPKGLPPSSICYDLWRSLSDQHHIDRINHLLVMADREKAGREASPTLIIIDAQSFKCDAPDGDRGYDAAKNVLGRKRHLAVDIHGRLLAVDVTTASIARFREDPRVDGGVGFDSAAGR